LFRYAEFHGTKTENTGSVDRIDVVIGDAGHHGWRHLFVFDWGMK